ncbi:MAG: S8 family serine peptidase [bacterium]|nr:S8 family serine peptidase [bacterium]
MHDRITHLLLVVMVVAFAVTSYASAPLKMNSDLETLGCVVVQFSPQLGDIRVENQDGVATIGNEDLDALARQFGVYQIERAIPIVKPPKNPNSPDLTRWYRVLFPEDIDLRVVAAKYAENPFILCAETEHNAKVDYIPTDPLFTTQWAMAKVNAPIAYNYTLGSRDVIVSIIDSGTDTAHADLRQSLWINPIEDLNHNGMIEVSEWNNIDDDGNGFIDDFWGWNFWQGNNDVNDPITAGHGSHCAGDAAATTNNGVGIASLGATARILTARAGDGQYVYNTAWRSGIVYAVVMGAKVISLSFGSDYYSVLDQQAVDYAWNEGALVFGAAGNDGVSTLHYPGALNNVIAVVATNSNDNKSSFSNYGSWVDICAPGENILSTVPLNSYANYDGTSMATPISAGLAALIWAVKPNWSNQQVQDQIMMTCTNIDQQNPGYGGLLGAGRINAGAAISALFPNFVLSNLVVDDVGGNNNGRPDPGETANLTYTLQNTSQNITARGVTVTLSCPDPDITLINLENYYGQINPGASVNNQSSPFSFSVATTSQPHIAHFVFTMEDSATGMIQIDSLSQIIGRPAYVIIDDDGGANFQQYYFNDFDSLGIVYDYWNINTQGEIGAADLDLYTTAVWFTSNEDNPLSSTEQGLIQTFLQSGKRLLLSGEDIDEQLQGTAFYSNVLHAESLNGTGTFQVAGIPDNPITNGHALYLVGSGGAGNSQSSSTINPANGSTLIYNYSSGIGAGISWDGGVNRLVYLGFNFEAISTISNPKRWQVLADIIAWFDGPSAVKPEVSTSIPTQYLLDQNYPNPFNPLTEINFGLPKSGHVRLSIYDLAGKLVTTLIDGSRSAGYQRVSFDASKLSSGIYLYRLEANNFSETRKMVLLK